MRKPLMVANWKMHKIIFEAESFAQQLAKVTRDEEDVLMVVCPPFTSLAAVSKVLAGSRVKVGAQDVFWEQEGAYTGRVSPRMISDAGAEYVIVGHSETRGRFGSAELSPPEELLASFGDTDLVVKAKLEASLGWGLKPILCVGETDSERRAGRTEEVIRTQLEAALKNVDEVQVEDVSIAYEPVWAIGTGNVCEAEEADRICGLIRNVIERRFSHSHAASTHILYGGSVKPENVHDLMLEPHIDGALVGGASLSVESFRKIVHFRYLAV